MLQRLIRYCFAPVLQLGHALRADLRALSDKVDTLMATEAELQADLDLIKTGVTTVTQLVTAQAQTIADLQAQVAAGSPVSQTQLDALKAEADAIVAALPAPAPPTP